MGAKPTESMFFDRSATTLTGLLERIKAGESPVHAMQSCGSAAALLCARARVDGGLSPLVYVVPDSDTARHAERDLEFLGRLTGEADRPLVVHGLFPPDAVMYGELRPDRRGLMRRLYALQSLAMGDAFDVLVVPAAALLYRYLPRDALIGAHCQLEVGAELELDYFAEQLVQLGYSRHPVVEDPGTFAVRGGLIDAWPIQCEQPLRAELFGDQVERLSAFDPDSQRLVADGVGRDPPPQRVRFAPVREAPLSNEAAQRASEALRSLCDRENYPSTKTRLLIEDVTGTRHGFASSAYLPAFYDLETLWDYLPADAVFLFEETPRAVAGLQRRWERAHRDHAQHTSQPHFPPSDLMLEPESVGRRLDASRRAILHGTAVIGPTNATGLAALESAPANVPSLGFDSSTELQTQIKQSRKSRGGPAGVEVLARAISEWQKRGLSVVLVTRSATQAERMLTLLSHHDVEGVRPAEPSLRSSVLQVCVGSLARGLVAESERLVLLCEDELFGAGKTRAAKAKRLSGAFLQSLRGLKPGDHVVHVEQGIGVYQGLETRTVGTGADAIHVELIVVQYSGNDRLYLPVHRLNQLQKYSGAAAAPKLDRLGGQSFTRTKSRAKKKVREMADQLLRLYAERANRHKQPLPPVDDDYRAFEASFPFEETPDQAAAIEEVAEDLESPKIMDRLICGDVGFGKTEVAIRAALRHTLAGRQVALLCPTTVLAQQHFLTFSRRLADFPIEIRSLSRFVSKRDQTETLKRLSDGHVDIVVGTHRVLSKDVQFKNLGLLVVDEEQRFGVVHKERLKQLKTTVDVLTLTATPIPRTLQLAVGGLRDMSVITTPPVDRRSIRTITARFDDALVRDAIERELARSGQVFYVYNRVEGIYERAARVQALVPGARVGIGHGQMRESQLEKTMLAFVNGEFDVLVATAIVESGLDIPRANTMIIDRADLFGLAQLYQLRGRVGRSEERAYCYLLVPPASKLSDEARQRIEAIERHSELGSGFHVASLDMELRGTGDLLGAEQSGTVASIGFEMFCRLLEEATAELRGEEVDHDIDPDMSVDVEALLPQDYIADTGLRLSFYKRLASVRDEPEVADLARELEERFGSLPTEAKRLVQMMGLKSELRRLRVLSCEANARQVSLHFRADTPLDAAAVTTLVASRPELYQLRPDMRLTRRATDDDPSKDGLVLLDRLLHELAKAER